MKIGILGLSKSGKTTIFESLTGREIQPSHKDKFLFGVVKVPDKRIDFLSDMFKPKKTTFPEIEFVDYVNQENLKSLSTEYIVKLKECDGILKVIRDFQNDIYPPALGTVNSLKELSDIDDEIILSDLDVIEKRLDKLKHAKYKLSTDEKSEQIILEKFRDILSNGDMLYNCEFSREDEKIIRNYGLISAKPEMVVINIQDADKSIDEQLKVILESKNRSYSLISGINEKELNSLDDESKNEFAKDMHIEEFGIQKVIKKFYSMLNLITFLTVGEDEVKGWTIKNPTNALKAAGKIHSDIERGFIKAQVVSFSDFEKHKSMKECVKSGVLRLEGKEYIVKDGDIIEFKFNV